MYLPLRNDVNSNPSYTKLNRDLQINKTEDQLDLELTAVYSLFSL